MKYTRYDMKKRKNNNLVFILVLLSTLIFAFAIGTVFSRFFLKNSTLNEIKSKNPGNAVNVINNGDDKKIVKYVAVQRGKFAKSENVDNAKNSLAAYGNPFTIQESDGTRVFLGIYSEQDGVNIMKTLSDKNIDNSKMVFQINVSGNNTCDDEISKIIDGEIVILNNLSDKSVKSVKTEEFKKWCSELKDVEKDSKNINILNELKTQVNSLPNELSKDKIQESYVYIYNTLKKFTTN